MFGDENPKRRLPLALESECAFDIQVPPVLIQRCYYCYVRLPWDPSTLTVTFIVQEFQIGLVLHALLDPLQQPLQSWISCRMDLFIQHDYSGEFFPQSMCFVMLVPLFYSEGFPFIA